MIKVVGSSFRKEFVHCCMCKCKKVWLNCLDADAFGIKEPRLTGVYYAVCADCRKRYKV